MIVWLLVLILVLVPVLLPEVFLGTFVRVLRLFLIASVLLVVGLADVLVDLIEMNLVQSSAFQ